MEIIDSDHQRISTISEAIRQLLNVRFHPGLIETKYLRMALDGIEKEAFLNKV